MHWRPTGAQLSSTHFNAQVGRLGKGWTSLPKHRTLGPCGGLVASCAPYTWFFVGGATNGGGCRLLCAVHASRALMEGDCGTDRLLQRCIQSIFEQRTHLNKRFSYSYIMSANQAFCIPFESCTVACVPCTQYGACMLPSTLSMNEIKICCCRYTYLLQAILLIIAFLRG